MSDTGNVPLAENHPFHQRAKMQTMIVRYERDIELRHSANFTCGGVTGHARECLRAICRKVVHDHCTTDTIHYTESMNNE